MAASLQRRISPAGSSSRGPSLRRGAAARPIASISPRPFTSAARRSAKASPIHRRPASKLYYKRDDEVQERDPKYATAGADDYDGDFTPGSWRRHFNESDSPDEAEGPTGMVQRAKAFFRPLPIKLVDFGVPAVGVLTSLALADGMHHPSNVAIGLVAGIAARVAQEAFLEQTVPFTKRVHTILLPKGAELAFGAQSYKQVLNQPQYKGEARSFE